MMYLKPESQSYTKSFKAVQFIFHSEDKVWSVIVGDEINITCVFAVGRGESSSEVDTNEDSELSSHSIPSHYQTHTATGWFKHCLSGQLAVRKLKNRWKNPLCGFTLFPSCHLVDTRCWFIIYVANQIQLQVYMASLRAMTKVIVHN